MTKSRRSRVISGVTLIAIGLLLLWLNSIEDIGQSVVFYIVGSLFLGAYLYSRSYGLLIPGCLLLGLGTGSFLARFDTIEEPSMVGLGAGFIAIFVIALLYEKRSHWWPLVPGGILLVNAFAIGAQLMDFLFRGGWPLVLVVIGIIVLIGAFGDRKSRKGAA